MSILMLIFSLCRILFYTFNYAQFPTAFVKDFFVGIWFDLITVCLLFYPLIVIELFPNKDRNRKWIKKSIQGLTFIAFFFGILINLIDIEYFQYSAARSSFGLIKMLGFGNDFLQQLPGFFIDYWYIFILLCSLLSGGFWLLKRFGKNKEDSAEVSFKKQWLIYAVFIGLFVFIGRGGFVSKPIRATEAAKFTTSDNVQLVLNSAFTFLNSWGSQGVDRKSYFSEDELKKIYSPIHASQAKGLIEGQNVVILLIESFSIEYISSLNGSHEVYTPFFDSLANSSLVFTNCFANGKKSMDALPAVIASVPKLMDTEYMLSGYNVNQLTSLPDLLKEKGYESGFFHGATNGSMNFDSFCDLANFDNYYGRSEYNNEDDYDGTWGIYDEPFMQWSVKQFSKMKTPFFSTLFTISSHPPYSIPEKYNTTFSKGPTKMHNAISYTDFALRQFFETAQNESWYNNTLFILLADHTPASKQKEYLSNIGQMNIPLLLYHPTDTFFRGTNDKIVGQIDILPAVLDLIGYDESYYSFGHSIFQGKDGFTASQIGGKYLFFGTFNEQDYLLIFQNDKVQGLYELDDRLQTNNLLASEQKIVIQLSNKLKAMIQTYNEAMITNRMKL